MAKQSFKVAFVSTYLPKQCGIATFTNDLITNVQAAAGQEFEPLVVAMGASPDIKYDNPVKFEARRNVKNDYVCAADFLNFSHVDLVSVQHEFGIFGGEAGAYLNLLLRRVNAPVITTLHTVLEEPEPHYYKSTIDVCELSSKIIVMNQRGIDMLTGIYGIDPNKIMLIPHGIPDLTFVDSSYYKHKFNIEGRKTILTFGLLSRNKGIEIMLKAMPQIVQADPSVLYIVLGATHPDVLKHDGEEYRFELQRIVEELGLQNHVMFHNQFVSAERLHNFLCAADIYVTPYLHRQQLTSGTLAFAVGTGKAVVSTPYWAAEELLADGRGKLVPFQEPNGFADAIIEILNDDTLFYGLRRKAFDYGRTMTWPSVGQRYWQLFTSEPQPGQKLSSTLSRQQEAISIAKMPEPSLEHLKRITDNTGIIQHAKFIIPDRQHGYCTDDNTRAVVAMIKYYSQYADPEALRLLDIYLSFVIHAQREDGTFHNFMTYERKWLSSEPAHDGLGRALWALGTVIGEPPLPEMIQIIKDLFDKSVSYVTDMSLRGKAYAIFGMADYLKQFPGASEIKRYLILAADSLLESYQLNSRLDWQWFEDILSYDNAVLPHALFIAYLTVSDEKYLLVANKACDFLMENTFNGNRFSFIGCDGWYVHGKERAHFDQQPLEPASTTMMLQAAYQATDNPNFLKLQKKAFDWFLGENDLFKPVYDFRTKGCGDGLEISGVNLNQGAESMISFLLAHLSVIESYSDQNQNEAAAKKKKSQIKIEEIPANLQNTTILQKEEEQDRKETTTI